MSPKRPCAKESSQHNRRLRLTARNVHRCAPPVTCETPSKINKTPSFLAPGHRDQPKGDLGTLEE